MCALIAAKVPASVTMSTANSAVVDGVVSAGCNPIFSTSSDRAETEVARDVVILSTRRPKNHFVEGELVDV
jgi:hypothetical protein